MPADSVLTPVEDVSLKGSRYGLLILLAGSLTMAGAAGFARYTFPLLLPDMRIALQSTYGNMGLLATMNNGGYVVSSLLGGILGARFGARRVIFISMVLAGVFTSATGLSPSVEVAMVFQLLTGLSAGGAIVPTVGVVAGWFEPRKRGVATGVMVGGFPLSILASSYFLPQLLIRMGPDAWRYGWMVLGALAILTFVPLPVAPYLAAVLGGLTLTAGMAVTVALLGDALGARLAAPAFGFVSLFFNLGQVLSPSISGAIIDATGSFASSLIAATASGFMAATLCLFLRVKGPARGY